MTLDGMWPTQPRGREETNYDSVGMSGFRSFVVAYQGISCVALGGRLVGTTDRARPHGSWLPLVGDDHCCRRLGCPGPIMELDNQPGLRHFSQGLDAVL